jgi:hypothetical protein
MTPQALNEIVVARADGLDPLLRGLVLTLLVGTGLSDPRGDFGPRYVPMLVCELCRDISPVRQSCISIVDDLLDRVPPSIEFRQQPRHSAEENAALFAIAASLDMIRKYYQSGTFLQAVYLGDRPEFQECEDLLNGLKTVEAKLPAAYRQLLRSAVGAQDLVSHAC